MCKKDTVKICMDVFVKTFQVSIRNSSLRLLSINLRPYPPNRKDSIVQHFGLDVIPYLQTEKKSAILTLVNNQRIV